jgi:glycosyltransferase involved in cell wall biosynthesis
MLTQAAWQNDSRVIREAESLASAGHEVSVISRSPATSHPESVVVNGVRYYSVPHVDVESTADIWALVAVDLRVRATAAARTWRGPGRLSGLRSATQLATFAIAAALLVPWIWAMYRWPRLLRRVDRRWQRSGLRREVLATLEPLRYLNDFAHRAGPKVKEVAPDVIHAHDLITLSAAVSIARSDGVRVVYDAHELETHTNYHSLSALTKRWIARYEETLIHECDAVVTVCDSIANWLAAAYHIARPIVVINAPRLTMKRPVGRPGLRETLRLPGDAVLAVYVGSVTVDRGLELAVEALRFLPEVHLATVGPRHVATEQAMIEVARTCGVSDRLHFVDAVPSEEVIDFIRSASLSVIPIQNVCLSYYMCFPNKLLESVFAGLPVAVADLAELGPFVDKHGVGVVMDETNPRAIAEALRDTVTRSEELRPSSTTIERIWAEYGWETQSRRLADLYERLVPPSRGGRRHIPLAVRPRRGRA